MTEIIITRDGVLVPFGSSKDDNAPIAKALQVGRVCRWTTGKMTVIDGSSVLVIIKGVRDAHGRRERFAARAAYELNEAGIPACVVVR